MSKNSSLTKIYKRAFVDHPEFISTAYVEILHDCNFSCVHCYVKNNSTKLRETYEIDYEKVAYELTKVGCMRVVLTGGEPLLCNDFVKIYTLFKKMGFLVTVMTNGSLITDEHIDIFSSLPPIGVEISLYGVDQGVFSSITGSEISSSVVIQNVYRLSKIPVKLYLKSVIMKENLHELPLFRSLAKKINARFRYDLTIGTKLNGSVQPFKHAIDSDSAARITSSDKKISSQLMKMTNYKAKKAYIDNSQTTKFFSCKPGLRSLVIDPRGYVYPCLYVRRGKHNIKDESLSSIHINGFSTIFKLERKVIKCDNCSDRNICKICEGELLIRKMDNSLLEYHCSCTKSIRKEIA